VSEFINDVQSFVEILQYSGSPRDNVGYFVIRHFFVLFSYSDKDVVSIASRHR